MMKSNNIHFRRILKSTRVCLGRKGTDHRAFEKLSHGLTRVVSLAIKASFLGLVSIGTVAAAESFTSAGKTYNITVYPGPADGKMHPLILLIHGNGAFRPPFGNQIRGFAESLAKQGYVTAVPGYYVNDNPPPQLDINPAPHVPTLADAIKEVTKRKDVDPDRLGLIGYSLGAAVAMMYTVSHPGSIKVLADYFGPVIGNTIIETKADTFPPTIIFHNEDDNLVRVEHSRKLDAILSKHAIDHKIIEYNEQGQLLNHPFAPGGYADQDSEKNVTEWFNKHLPPVGR